MTLQEQVDALPSGGGTIELEAGAHYQHGPLNMRGKPGVRLVGKGTTATRVACIVAPDQPLLFDLTGSHHCGLERMTVAHQAGPAPRVGLLLARDGADSANFHRFESLRWEAKASLANVASFGSENNLFTHCEFLNADPGGMNLVTGRENDLEVESPFGEVHGGSNLCIEFLGCRFGVYHGVGAEINIDIRAGTGHFGIRGGTMSNKTDDKTEPSDPWAAGIQIGAGDSSYPCHQIVIDGLEAETYGCKSALQVVGRVRGLSLRHTLLQSLESAIWVTPGGELQDSTIEQNSLEAGMAQYDWSPRALMVVDGEMTDCLVDLRSRWLGLLAEDQSPNDQGHRPDAALTVTAESVCYGNEIILRHARHLMAPGDFTDANYARLMGW